MADALTRALPLVAPRPEHPDVALGYLDLLGGDGSGAVALTPAGRMMVSRALPAVYERWWRPAFGRVTRGALSGGMRDEHRIARLLLGLTPGDGVLDVACGPGNFTRDFARVVGPTGLAVGLDASATMLARAVRDTERAKLAIAYVRGDAQMLPFRDGSFAAVCCFGALHVFEDPFVALDAMTRVLTPGGRIAIFTSVRLSSAVGRTVGQAVAARSGIRLFGADELVDALHERGFDEVRQRITGVTQFVGGRLRR
jgi:ubiquinone/menaquinone biosynthesis C-methylase UbiE